MPSAVRASLTKKEWKDAKDWVSEYHPDFLPDFIEFIGSKKDAFTASFCSMNESRTEDFIRSQILTGESGDKIGLEALRFATVVSWNRKSIFYTVLCSQ